MSPSPFFKLAHILALSKSLFVIRMHSHFLDVHIFMIFELVVL